MANLQRQDSDIEKYQIGDQNIKVDSKVEALHYLADVGSAIQMLAVCSSMPKIS